MGEEGDGGNDDGEGGGGEQGWLNGGKEAHLSFHSCNPSNLDY